MTNTTDHLAALRKGIEDVLELHTEGVWVAIDGSNGEWCNHCKGDWPCDAATQARRMTALLDELEAATGLLHNRSNNHVYSADQRTAYWLATGIVENIIASAAQEEEGDSG